MKYIIVLLVMIFIGCTDQEKPNVLRISCNIENQDTIRYSSLFDSVEYIQFEKTDHSILGYIQKTLFASNFILVLSNSASLQSITIFLKNGKHFSTIDCQGRGPGEYLSIGTFSFNERDSTIFLYDQSGRDLKTYTIYGEYLNTRKLGLLGEDFHFLQDGKIAFYSPSEYNSVGKRIIPKGLYLLSSGGNYEKTLVEVPKNNSLQLSGLFYFSEYDRKVNFMSSFDDNIYSIANDSIIIHYKLDFGGYMLNADLRTKQIEELSGKYVVAKYAPLETKTYLMTYLLITIGQMPQLLIINKEQDSGKLYKHIINDIDHIPGFLVGSHENKIYSVINATDFKFYQKRFKPMNSTNLFEDGNPILQIFHLKE